MRDFAQIEGKGRITRKIVQGGLERLEIDELGLEKLDRDILRAIIQKYAGGPVGAETLAITVGEGVDSLEDFYEPYLIQAGLVARTSRGRVATAAAYRHLGLEIPSEDGRLLF
jgi:Holliday junction DNA helicase RuvB